MLLVLIIAFLLGTLVGGWKAYKVGHGLKW